MVRLLTKSCLLRWISVTNRNVQVVYLSLKECDGYMALAHTVIVSDTNQKVLIT